MADITVWMKTEDVAAMFDVKELTVREWLRLGKLAGTKINGRWRVKQDDAIALAEQNYGVGSNGAGTR